MLESLQDLDEWAEGFGLPNEQPDWIKKARAALRRAEKGFEAKPTES
jgi:hypothetical protein